MIRKLAILSLAGLSCAATASAIAQDADCYDADVSASIVAQTPTVMPDCGGDCIIMRWPWIIDLDVQEVHTGDLQRGALAVLTIQHTDFRSDLGVVRWKLRNNLEGGLNVIGFMGGGPERHCSVDDEPVRAHITPSDVERLDGLRREGRAFYGRED